MSAELGVALATVCRVLGAPRSTVYARRVVASSQSPAKRGPRTAIDDETLLRLIRLVIVNTPFSGEGQAR